MRKLGIVVSLLVAFALLAVACAAPAAAPAAPTKAPAAPAPAKAPEKPAVEKPAAPTPAAPKKLLMGTTQQASSTYAYYAAVAKLINSKVPELSITPVETGGVKENLLRLHKGEFDIILTAEDTRYQAWHGIGPYKDDPIKETRLLWLHIVLPCPPIVREDSGVRKLEDLEGKDFSGGMRGSTAEATTKLYFEALGIKPKWYVGGLEDIVAATKDKRIAGFAKCFAAANAPDASVLDLQTSAPVRILALTEEHIKKITAQHPWMTFGDVVAGTYKAEWNKDLITAWAALASTSATPKLPEELAYKITKAAVEDNKPGGEGVLAASFPGVKGLDFAQQTVRLGMLPLHAGAIKYYKELGLQIKDEQIPPEVKR